MILTFLTDSQWRHVKPILHPPADRAGRPHKRLGRPPAPERDVLNGILHSLSTGCSWLDLPYPRYPSGSVCYRGYHAWLKDGTWAAIVDALVKELHHRTGIDLWTEWTRFISSSHSDSEGLRFEIPPAAFTSDSDCVVVLVFMLNLLEILSDDHRQQLLRKRCQPASDPASAGFYQNLNE